MHKFNITDMTKCDDEATHFRLCCVGDTTRAQTKILLQYCSNISDLNYQKGPENTGQPEKMIHDEPWRRHQERLVSEEVSIRTDRAKTNNQPNRYRHEIIDLSDWGSASPRPPDLPPANYEGLRPSTSPSNTKNIEIPNRQEPNRPTDSKPCILTISVTDTHKHT